MDINEDKKIRENYEKIFSEVRPDKDFLSGLEKKLDEKKRKKRIHVMIRTFAACAAAVCIVAGGMVFLSNSGSKNIEADSSVSDSRGQLAVLGVGEDKLTYQKGLFDTSDASVSLNDLKKLLSDKDTVVYKSNENRFSAEDEMSGEQRSSLLKKLDLAKDTSETADVSKENKEHYMAVSKDGTIVKFTISADILTLDGKNFKLS